MRAETAIASVAAGAAEQAGRIDPSRALRDLVARSPYLTGLPADTRDRVLELAGQVTDTVLGWASAQPGVRAERLRPLALTLAAATPFGDVESLASTARLNLWIFALDDVFDEWGLPIDELRRRGDRYVAIARGSAPRPGDDELAILLAGVRADLAEYPLFTALGQSWAGAVAEMIDGMIREAVWQRAHLSGHGPGLPSYEEYLAGGLSSVGAPTHIWTALITIDDPSTPDHLPALRRLIEPAALVVRLANDLQSAAKEAGEGTINGLTILAAEGRRRGLAPREALAWAQARVRCDIEGQLLRLSRIGRPPVTSTGRPEAAIVNIARFVSEFYRSHDFHTFDRPSPPGSESAMTPRTAAREGQW